MENNDTRRTERLRKNKWEPCNFMDLKKGDIFRLFDDGENPIEIGQPYIATSDAYLNVDKIGAVKCDFYDMEEGK